MNRAPPEVELVRRAIQYNPATGEFFRTTPTGLVKRTGLGKKGTGYHQIFIAGRMCLAHRVAFVLMTGAWPKEEVDHINGVRTDNRWSNLRECNKAENLQNLPASGVSKNKSGRLGVCPFRNKWRAQITVRGRKVYLGHFESPEAASAAYLLAKSKLHHFSPTPRAEGDLTRRN